MYTLWKCKLRFLVSNSHGIFIILCFLFILESPRHEENVKEERKIQNKKRYRNLWLYDNKYDHRAFVLTMMIWILIQIGNLIVACFLTFKKERDWEKTCKGNLTKADSKRPWQNLWTQRVKIGSATRHADDCSASLMLNNPIRRSWAIIKPIITRRCTWGQNAAPLSYFWLYTLMIWRIWAPWNNSSHWDIILKFLFKLYSESKVIWDSRHNNFSFKL